MILENLSRIEHVPSTQFHDRPPDPEAPEEVSLIPLSIPCFNSRSLCVSCLCPFERSFVLQKEEDMDKRPPQRSRLWSGGAYDSDTEDPDNVKSESTDLTANSHMKVCASAAHYVFLAPRINNAYCHLP
jgi:histone deacetylase 1/2